MINASDPTCRGRVLRTCRCAHAPMCWVVDPVDGTANYVAGLALFGTAFGERRPAWAGAFLARPREELVFIAAASAAGGMLVIAIGEAMVAESLHDLGYG